MEYLNLVYKLSELNLTYELFNNIYSYFERINSYFPKIILLLDESNVFVADEDNIGFVWNFENYYIDIRFSKKEILLESKTPEGIIKKSHNTPFKMIYPLLYSFQMIHKEEIDPVEHNYG